MVHDSSSEQPDLEVGLEDCQKVVRELTRALVSTLRALGQTGQAEQASRLAARAYTALRLTDPKTAERINGVMHYLALPDTNAAAIDFCRKCCRVYGSWFAGD